jgi:hypothetical protein
MPPQLQRENDFENTVSGLTWKFSFNSEFITRGPNCPALRSKKDPSRSLGS